MEEPQPLAMASAPGRFVAYVQVFLDNPLYSLATAVFALILVVVVSDYLDYVNQRRRLGGDIPIVGDAPYIWRRLRWTEAQSNLRNVLQRGYDNFTKKSKLWAYPGQHDGFIIVIPPEANEEVKNVSPDKLSFLQAVEDSFHFTLHTKILGRGHVDAVRQSVNKNMGHLHKTVVSQADATIPEFLDEYGKGHEPMAVFITMWHLIHTISTSFLIGPELSRNTEYMNDVEYYCLNVPSFTHLYFRVPGLLRKAFWYASPGGFRIRKTVKKLKRVIIPEIWKAIDAWRNKTSASEEYTLLDAMLKLKAERGQLKRDPQAMTKAEEAHQIDVFSDEVIFTAFDSAGPVACLLTQLIFESICDKDLTNALRGEIADALAKNDGVWSEDTMSSLPRLESFTRETLRFNGPTLCTYRAGCIESAEYVENSMSSVTNNNSVSVTRSALQPLKLNSGVTLPTGSIMSSPAWFVHNDENNYEHASQFDAYRFYDEKTNSATTRATTPSAKFLAYGYGSQICPGRFLGIRMTQILFAKILMRYDMDLMDGQSGRPDNIFMPGQILPPYMEKIVIKLRDEGSQGV